MVFRILAIILVAFFHRTTLSSQVLYQEGSILIQGVQLLQDYRDTKKYYYLPQSPRLSRNEDGDYDLLLVKYLGDGTVPSGGLFHALITLSLEESELTSLEKELQKKIPGATIAGPVPIQEKDNKDVNNDEQFLKSSFQLVSSLLDQTEGKTGFTTKVITSGHAPFTAGSKAAISALLNQQGATLLWNSLEGSTSDVSVSVEGQFVAMVKGYNAIVNAEMESIYAHFSSIENKTKGFKKDQIRDVTDELKQKQLLKIEVFDASTGFGIDAGNMSSILDIVTQKLIEVMFDMEKGWSKKPERETAVEAGQLLNRQERGWFAETFLGPEDTPYYSDDQYVIKDRKDIQSNKFYLNLSKSSTIKVPFYTSGNIKGLMSRMDKLEREKYFKIVSLRDPSFEEREVFLIFDESTLSAFDNALNFVSVTVRKILKGETVFTKDIVFTKADFSKGGELKKIKYPRMGVLSDDFLDYEYRIQWGINGIEKPIIFPNLATDWIKSKEPTISLKTPLNFRIITLEIDKDEIDKQSINKAFVEFFTILDGKAISSSKLLIKDSDTELSKSISLYGDVDEPMAYQVTWYQNGEKLKQELKELKSDYILLNPPQ